MLPAAIEIRSFAPSDVKAAVKLYEEEEWPTSPIIVQLQLQTFGAGTFLAAYDGSGNVIGTCALYRLTDAISYIDYVVVSKRHRGRGTGTRLIKAAVEQAKGTNVVLDSFPECAPLYEKKYGFERDVLLYEVEIQVAADPTGDGVPGQSSVSPITSDVIGDVMRYDAEIHRLGHRTYFERLLLDEDHFSLCSMADGTVNGILLYSPSQCFLSALHADSPVIAGKLLSTMFHALPTGRASLLGTRAGKIHAVLLECSMTIFVNLLQELRVQFDGPRVCAVRMVSREKVTMMSYEKIYCILYYSAYIL